MYTKKNFRYVTYKDAETTELTEKLSELIIKYVGINPNITFIHAFWKGWSEHWEVIININETNYIHQEISLYHIKQYIKGIIQFEPLINKIKENETKKRTKENAIRQH